MKAKPIVYVSEWAKVILPSALNREIVKTRLLRAANQSHQRALDVKTRDIFARDLVGIISTQDLTLYILPKTNQNTFDVPLSASLLKNMLIAAGRFSYRHSNARIGAGTQDIFNWIIGRVISDIDSQLDLGVPRRYFETVEDLPTIRGRVDMDHLARVAPGTALKVRVRHAPLQHDNQLSRLIKALLGFFLQQTRSTKLRSSIHGSLDKLSMVQTRILSHNLVDEAVTNVFEREWDWVVDLAATIVRGGSPDPLKLGQMASYSILFSLHGLFERVVRARLASSLHGAMTLRATKSIGRLLTNQESSERFLGLEPDIVIDSQGRPLMMGDVKWKNRSSGDLFREDVFQILTYIVHSGVRSGFLVYPAHSLPGSLLSCETYEFNSGKNTVHLISVDAHMLCDTTASIRRAVQNELYLAITALAKGAPFHSKGDSSLADLR